MPEGWNLIINEAQNDTNVCQIGRRLEDWMHMSWSRLCNPSVQKHIENTRAGIVLGRNSQNFTTNHYGYMSSAMRSKPSPWFASLRTWPPSERTSGARLRGRSVRCASCIGFITTASWSRKVPSSPW